MTTTATAPRSSMTHLLDAPGHTCCGRTVRDTWHQQELRSAADAPALVTCSTCLDWALFHRDLEAKRAGETPAATETVELETQPATPQLPAAGEADTLLVVPCSGAKLDHAAPARDLYRGTLTTMGLAAADAVAQSFAGTRTLILSALHGLVDTDRVLEPYDVKMGDPGSIGGEQLAEQLRATGARRVIALTPNGYTAALAHACDLAGMELVMPLWGSRGIGEQRGRLATLRRSAGYGEDWGLTSFAELRAAEDAAAVEAAAQRIAAGQPSGLPEPRNGREQRVAQEAQERAEQLLAEQEPELVHLMDADGLDTCGTAPAGRLVTAPDTTPERITCPRCRELMAKAEHADDGRHVHTEWTQCRHRGGQCCAACHVSNFPNGTPAERMAVLEAEQALPPVHGPHGPERFGAVLSAETLLDRGRRAILRADQLQRAARSAVQLLPPAGTLHA